MSERRRRNGDARGGVEEIVDDGVRALHEVKQIPDGSKRNHCHVVKDDFGRWGRLHASVQTGVVVGCNVVVLHFSLYHLRIVDKGVRERVQTHILAIIEVITRDGKFVNGLDIEELPVLYPLQMIPNLESNSVPYLYASERSLHFLRLSAVSI